VNQALRGYESPVEEKAATVVSYYFTLKLVSFAMAEAVALCGFVLAFIGHYFWDQYLLSFAALVLLLWQFPSKAFLDGLVTEIETRG
jgi:hypothetical protein